MIPNWRLMFEMASTKPYFEMRPKTHGKRLRNKSPPVPQPAEVVPGLCLGDAGDAMDGGRL
eukprot:6795477-Lingulodinium_polyedra.AAC.1